MTASSIAHSSALARTGHHSASVASQTPTASAEFTDLIGSFLECFTFSAEQEPVETGSAGLSGKVSTTGKKDPTASSSGDAKQEQESQPNDSVQALLVAVPVVPEQPPAAPVTWQFGLARGPEQHRSQELIESEASAKDKATPSVTDAASLLLGTPVSAPRQDQAAAADSQQGALGEQPKPRPEFMSQITIDLSDRPKIQNQTGPSRAGIHAFEVRLTEDTRSASDTNVTERAGEADAGIDPRQDGQSTPGEGTPADKLATAGAAKTVTPTPLANASGAASTKESPREGLAPTSAKQANSPSATNEATRRPVVQPSRKIEPSAGREKGQSEEPGSGANGGGGRHLDGQRITTESFAANHLKDSAIGGQGSGELRSEAASASTPVAAPKADFEPIRGESSKAVEDITVRVDTPGSAGHVEIRFKQDGESIRVSAMTADADTASTLHNHVPEMKRDLQSHGWNAEALESSGEISTHSTESGGSSGNHSQDGDRNHQMRDASEGRQQRQGRQLADWQDAYDSQSDGFRFSTFTSRGVNH